MIKSQYKVNMGNKKKILIIVIIVLMIAIFCGVFGSIVWFNNMLKPVNESSTETKKVEIEQGLSTVKIIEKLKQENLIKDELATKIFIKLNNVNSLKAGKYELSPSMSLEKILQTMVDGDVINEEITITFKEGKNIRWIAKKIAEETSNSEEDVYKYMRKYMLDKVAAKKHASTAKMELVPGFYAIYSNIFLKIMRTTDLQESTQAYGNDYYDVTIKKCLWHTACVENGCENLCRLFCDVDDVTYGGLKKIGFTRTKTLGYGGDCCDFHFFKK